MLNTKQLIVYFFIGKFGSETIRNT